MKASKLRAGDTSISTKVLYCDAFCDFIFAVHVLIASPILLCNNYIVTIVCPLYSIYKLSIRYAIVFVQSRLPSTVNKFLHDVKI